MNLSRTNLLVIMFTAIVFSLCLNGDAAQRTSNIVTDAKENFVKRIQILENSEIKFTFQSQRPLTTEEMEQAVIKLENNSVLVRETRRSFGVGFIWRDSPKWKIKLETSYAGEDSVNMKPEVYIASNSDDRFEKLFSAENKSHTYGSIDDKELFPADFNLGAALGLTIYKPSQWIRPEEVSAWNGEINSDKTVSLIHKKGSGQKHIFYLDAENNFAVIAYEGLSPEGLTFFKAKIEQHAEFQGIAVPQATTLTYFRRDGTIRREDLYTITGIEASHNKDYRIVWPLGSIVSDQRTGAALEVASKSQALSDATLQKAVVEFKQKYGQDSFIPKEELKPAPQSSISWVILLVVNVIVVAALLGIFWLKKR